MAGAWALSLCIPIVSWHVISVADRDRLRTLTTVSVCGKVRFVHCELAWLHRMPQMLSRLDLTALPMPRPREGKVHKFILFPCPFCCAPRPAAAAAAVDAAAAAAGAGVAAVAAAAAGAAVVGGGAGVRRSGGWAMWTQYPLVN